MADCNGTPGNDRTSEAILVVEDDYALLKLIQQQLGEHGFHTHGVTSGASALKWLEDHSARLMLLDYSLPDMQGEELLEQLAARGAQVPFVIATGHGSEAVAVEMMKRGARDYMIKGASFMKLLPTVIDQTLTRLDQERRLAEAEEQLRAAHEELENCVRQRTAELAELTHELNQPISAITDDIQTCGRLLQSRPENHVEDLLATIGRIGKQARQAADIVGRLRCIVRTATRNPDRGVTLEFDLPTDYEDSAGEQ